MGGGEALVAVLGAHLEHCRATYCDKGSTLAACLALGNLVAGYSDGARAVLSCGGVESCLAVIQRYPDCEEIQERGCYLLYWLRDDDGAKARITRGGGNELLMAATARFPDNAVLRVYADVS